MLRDLLTYRESRRVAQYAALVTAVDMADEDGVDVTLRGLREARRVVAERRRARSAP